MRRILAGTTLAAGLTLAMIGPAAASDIDDGVIHVPGDFVPELSDTRADGNFALVENGLRVWTKSNTSADKVAEYVATSTPLAAVGEPTLNYTTTAGTIPPGFQLVTDFDADTQPDGILIGEPTMYGTDWWVSNGAKDFVKTAAPSHTGGFGSANHGTLDQWRTEFPNANVLAFGFSLGSGVYGDYVINSIAFAGETYTFPVILKSKDECKNGGWARSTDPVFKNQGQCVSTFASAKATAEPTPEPIVAPQPAATASITKFMTKIWPFA